MSGKTKSDGFTIVELLIVIVVIGVLAAITIVAYRGMQQRATTVAITSAVDQWEKIIRMEIAIGEELPASGEIVCLGGSKDDFPVTSNFLAGECINRVADGVRAGWSYSEDFFSAWQASRPSGLLPQTNLTFSTVTIQARGIVAYFEPDHARLEWIPQVADQCGRGSPAIPDNGLSGGDCLYRIDY